MIKKILNILLTVIALTNIFQLSAMAYTVDSSFRPENSPFAIEEQIEEEGSAGATIIILQIISGGLLYFAAPIGVIMIVVVGLQMAIANGDSEKIEESKKHLTWSVAGLAIIILSYSAVRILITLIVDSTS